MADAFWTHNIQHLDKAIKRVSFVNAKKPRDDADTTLYKLREELDYLKAEVRQIIRCAPPSLAEYFVASATRHESSTGTPLKYLEHIAEDAVALEEFLTTSLNLLLASIALENGRRADKLTWFAAVYIPLSFVTGIFGMNLRELNGSTLSLWVCFAVLAMVLVLTVALTWLYDRVVGDPGGDRRDV